MRRTSIIVILLIGVLLIPQIQSIYAKAPEILFSDAWFGEVDRRIEVAPGDHGVQLVVRLVNAWNKTFRFAEGKLYLPDGFRDSVTGKSVTRSYAVQCPKAGSYFYLKFLVDIGEDVKIGEYMAKLWIRYVFWDEENVEHAYVYVKFRVTGRSDLKLSMSPEEIEPDEAEDLTLKIENTGSARASSIILRIDSVTKGLAIISGQGTHIIGDLEPGESEEVSLKVLAESFLADGIGSMRVSIRYLDSYGQMVEDERILSVKISPLGGVGVVLDSYLRNSMLKPSKIADLMVVVANRGTEVAKSVDVSISLPEATYPPITLVEGAMASKLGDLKPGEEKELKLKVFVNKLAAGKSFTIPVILSYADEEGRHVVKRFVTITVVEESRRKRLSIYCDEYVRGGLIEEIKVRIKNIAGEDLRDLTLTLTPEASWVTLLGPTTWHIDSIKNGEEKILKLKMYVPSETSMGSTIGEPFNLRVDASFEDSSGLVRNEVHELGMYVRGIIDVKLQDISLERLGKELFLVGRLLNEGTETASYTRVKIVGGDLKSSTVSYLGDLNPNAPLLFNIPIEYVTPTESNMSCHIVLNVTYMDSLRNRGSTILEAHVRMPAAESEVHQSPQLIGLREISIIAVVSIAVIVSAIYLVRRRARAGETT